MTETSVGQIFVDSPALVKAFRFYQAAEYEKALEVFGLLERETGAVPQLQSYIQTCERVTSAEPSPADEQYIVLRRIAPLFKWLYVPGALLALVALASFDDELFTGASARAWFELLMAAAVLRGAFGLDRSLKDRDEKRRCKYCGHYTRYIEPNEGVAYFNTNNCRVCGRGYPMPDVFWDSVEGKEYMYDRGSVNDREFYAQFEADNQGDEPSQAADYWLRGDGAQVEPEDIER